MNIKRAARKVTVRGLRGFLYSLLFIPMWRPRIVTAYAGKRKKTAVLYTGVSPSREVEPLLASGIAPIADNCKYVSVQGHATLSGLDPLP